MMNSAENSKLKRVIKAISLIVIVAFIQSSVIWPEKVYGAAATVPAAIVTAGTEYAAPFLKGMTVHPEDPFRFDFIVDNGNTGLTGQALKPESTKLIRYFLASVTIPDDEQWVNLSPYERDRIIPEALGTTELGRDLLSQDLMLKQLTASLIYPEKEMGKDFWDRVYRKAQALYGTTEILFNVCNRVWVVPDKAVVYEHGNMAMIIESRMKVMLEEDYFETRGGARARERDISSAVVRDIIVPEIEKEVNTGKGFSTLRQIYNSMILATWYKARFKNSIVNKAYADQKKVAGVDTEEAGFKQKIYNQYLESFKRGAYNYIKTAYDPYAGRTVSRKYFSGGFEKQMDAVLETRTAQTHDLNAVETAPIAGETYEVHSVRMIPVGVGKMTVLRRVLRRIASREAGRSISDGEFQDAATMEAVAEKLVQDGLAEEMSGVRNVVDEEKIRRMLPEGITFDPAEKIVVIKIKEKARDGNPLLRSLKEKFVNAGREGVQGINFKASGNAPLRWREKGLVIIFENEWDHNPVARGHEYIELGLTLSNPQMAWADAHDLTVQIMGVGNKIDREKLAAYKGMIGAGLFYEPSWEDQERSQELINLHGYYATTKAQALYGRDGRITGLSPAVFLARARGLEPREEMIFLLEDMVYINNPKTIIAVMSRLEELCTADPSLRVKGLRDVLDERLLFWRSFGSTSQDVVDAIQKVRSLAAPQSARSEKSDGYYGVLGIGRDATPDEIKKAFRELIKIHHPDKNPENVAAAEKLTKEITEAYETLRDPGYRKAYDLGGKDAVQELKRKEARSGRIGYQYDIEDVQVNGENFVVEAVNTLTGDKENFSLPITSKGNIFDKETIKALVVEENRARYFRIIDDIYDALPGDISAGFFSDLKGDLFGFAVKKGHMTARYDRLKNEPVADFHEIGEYVKDDLLKFQLTGNELTVYSRAHQDAAFNIEKILLDEEALRIATTEKKGVEEFHYLLRAFQRMAFQDHDRDLTRKLRDLQGKLSHNPGGIDLNAAWLDMRIHGGKTDMAVAKEGDGSPVTGDRIDGLKPLIFNITSVSGSSLMLVLFQNGPAAGTRGSGMTAGNTLSPESILKPGAEDPNVYASLLFKEIEKRIAAGIFYFEDLLLWVKEKSGSEKVAMGIERDTSKKINKVSVTVDGNTILSYEVYGAAFTASSRPVSSGAVTGYNEFVKNNAALLAVLLKESKSDTLLRVPVEAIADENSREKVKKFFAALKISGYVHIELYSGDGVRAIDESTYSAFGLHEPPAGFSKKKENTITLMPVYEDEELTSSGVRSRLGAGGNVALEQTVVVPIRIMKAGSMHDAAELISGSIFGFDMLFLARQKKDLGTIDAGLVKEIQDRYRRLLESLGVSGFDLTENDLVKMATGDINEIITPLKKLVKLLPLRQLSVEEIKQVYELTLPIITNA